MIRASNPLSPKTKFVDLIVLYNFYFGQISSAHMKFQVLDGQKQLKYMGSGHCVSLSLERRRLCRRRHASLHRRPPRRLSLQLCCDGQSRFPFIVPSLAQHARGAEQPRVAARRAGPRSLPRRRTSRPDPPRPRSTLPSLFTAPPRARLSRSPAESASRPPRPPLPLPRSSVPPSIPLFRPSSV